MKNTLDSSLLHEKFIAVLLCPSCQGKLTLKNKSPEATVKESLLCGKCRKAFPVINDIPRMLLSPLRETRIEQQIAATGKSFGFEWNRFPEMYKEWESNFRGYMAPHGPDFFAGKRVLDAGCGSGRHAYYAARYSAEVWAVDLSSAVEVARRNTAQSKNVYTIQADLHRLPFALESFDFIYSIGVLHHLPNPEAAFHNLLRFLKPGGDIQIYLYWKPEGQPVKQALLAIVTAIRKLTSRLPHKITYALAFPAAWIAFIFFVWPYQLFRRIPVPALRRFAERIPLKQYSFYPFRVCINDQFDRFSAPIENRYTKDEVEKWFSRAGLEEVTVRPNFGWCGSGRKPHKLA